MRLTRISVYSASSVEALDFSMDPADEFAKYQVKGLTGLDADEIIPRYYSSSQAAVSGGGPFDLELRGDRFYDMVLKPRNIVINVRLNPNYALDEKPSDLRDDIYRAISPARTGEVVVQLQDGPDIRAAIKGFLTKLEAPLMSNKTEATLTIRCDDPVLRAITPVTFSFTPEAITNPIKVPDAISTAPHGIKMNVWWQEAQTSFVVQDVETNPSWKFTVTPTGGVAPYDTIELSSESFDKYLYRRPNTGPSDPLLDKVSPDSVWPIIFPGTNELWIPNAEDIFSMDLSYYPAFWGV